MAKKKTKHTHTPKPKHLSVSQEDSTQAQPVLAQYHQIAVNLRRSFSREQAGEALAEMNTMPENAQIAIVKALAKEAHVDAADVLTAVYELSPIKSVRKEARRSLIRLEEARIYPQWNVPIEQTSPYRIVAPSLPDEFIPDMPGVDEELGLDEEPEEESINLQGLTAQEVVTNFIEYWVEGDYGIAYDLLSSESPIREGLARKEWIERRKAWLDEADPQDLQTDFFHEREAQQSRLWLPFTASRSTTHKEIEVGWSMELGEAALSQALPELPQATAIYKETGRHWFWSSYTLVQEQGEWRIQSMTDEGTNTQNLSVEELQNRTLESDQDLKKFAQQHTASEMLQATEEELQQYFEEVGWQVIQAIYYNDALIKKLPLDRSAYEEAAGRAFALQQYERSIVYLELLAERFPEQRARVLRQLAQVQKKLGEKYYEMLDDGRAERCQELAEEALRESLAIEDSFGAHMSLAELFVDKQRFDEAEEHLLQAKALSTKPDEEAHVELDLGEIAMGREQYQKALSHYQHVAEFDPTDADSWCYVAEAHTMLKNFEEAEANYRRAISLQPDNQEIYLALSKMYTLNDQPAKAIEAIEEGLSNNPDSAALCTYLGVMYLENGDYDQAEVFLDKAERIDPELPLISMFRQVLKMERARPLAKKKSIDFPVLNKPNREERRGRKHFQ